MCTEEKSGPSVDARPSGSKTWLRGLLLGAWIGLMIGAYAGYRLGQVFPERVPVFYLMPALCCLIVVGSILNMILRPSQQEVVARAVRWSRRISPRTARTLKIVGLPLSGLGFTCMLLRFWTPGWPVFWVAFALLGIGSLVLFPAALAEKPSGVSADEWERLRNADQPPS